MLLALAGAACGGDSERDVAGTPAPVAATPVSVPVSRTDRDVTYCRGGTAGLKMDVYYPAAGARRPAPLAIYVHGGAFIAGDKATGAGSLDIAELVRRGYVVAAINYRLAPADPFPAAIEDVKCAVRHFRANAATYGIDADRIGAWGGSAGGNLVSLLGVTDASANLEGDGGYRGVSSRVQAVVDFFGPSDIRATAARPLLGGYIPEGERAVELAEKASPVTFVSRDDPPFLILHGENDAVVPLVQSQLLYDALTRAGVTCQLVVVKNAGHGFAPSGGPISPTRVEITRMVADFFDRYLLSR